uniref:Mitotic spindle checkpoint protein MAD1 isoform X3 n=1 Tax=Elaeis guineensis var. tenera TaxID=51953 RepID=A0A8N4IBY0_ELAGV|nr:mitotic spindle checkpoint protein MAD1 isoform X3 [Elaeis guineensis]
MILRTPPPRKRRAGSVADHESPVSDRRLVLYDDPIPVPSVDPLPDQMVCTYHCRQMVKSEFVVALDTAEKQVHGYQAQLETLKTELHVSEDERKKCQDRLRYLEQELEASKGREHALQERLIKEVNDSQGRYQLQVKRCSELEVQLKKEVDSRKNSESSAASAKERATDLEEKLQRLSESSEREKNRLQRELAHWQDDSKLSVSRKTADLERMRLKAENLEEESELLKKQLKEIREQLDECLHQKSALECKLSTIPTPSESTPSEDKNLVKHLREELRNYEAEVQEARRLKSCHMNNELLKEKLLEEKGRREKAEIELSQLQEAQLNAQNLELELMSWKSLLKEIPDVTSYDDIPKKIAGLQKEAIESLIKVGEISAHLKELEVSLELAELCKQHAEKESLLAKEKAENSALEVKRLELMLGHGDYSVANTKVLRMVNTLAVDSETKQTIEALQAELKKTQAKLQAVEELKGQSDAGNVIDVDISEKLAQLKGQIAILEKREERYKAVFAERISVFRRACCSLFGYKIVMDDQQRPNGIPVTRFTLQSIYAQSDDEKLEFEYESGNTNILVNDYSSQPEISQQIEIFIKKMNSIPAFTANLTMESFNKRTLS